MDLKVTNNDKHFSATPEISSNGIKRNGLDEEKLAKVAKEFETLLTSMMLKSMSSKSEDGVMGEESFGGDYYDMIFQNEIASKFSDGKGIGVADMIFRKMTGKSLPENEVKGIMPFNLPPIKLNNLEDIKIKNFDEGIRSISPSKNSINRLNQFEPFIVEASEKFGVDKNIIRSVILTESAGNDKALSKANAKGLMQLIDSTASDMGVTNVWNPRENIMGGTKYLSQMLRQYNGDLKLALAGYNAGPGNVNKYNGVPPFEETKNYITRVMGYMNHLKGKVAEDDA